MGQKIWYRWRAMAPTLLSLKPWGGGGGGGWGVSHTTTGPGRPPGDLMLWGISSRLLHADLVLLGSLLVIGGVQLFAGNSWW